MRPCAREAELKSHLRSGDWPHACADLRVHVQGCARCSRHLLLGQAFQRARAESAGVARLEPPGLLWWRAQLRRRREIYEQISKPIHWAQRFALVLTVAVAAGLAVSWARQGLQWLLRLEAPPRGDTSALAVLWSFGTAPQGSSLLLLIGCVTVVAVLGAVVLYLVHEPVRESAAKTSQGRN